MLELSPSQKKSRNCFGTLSLGTPSGSRDRYTAREICLCLPKRCRLLLTTTDSFSDAEAHALMMSGYKMTTHNLKERGFDKLRHAAPWDFLYIDQAMRSGDARLLTILEHAGSVGFKVWGLLGPCDSLHAA